MNQEEEFDEIMRSKFSEVDFPFDEGNWEKAEEMIDQQRKKEKRKRWFLIYFYGISTGIALFTLLYYFTGINDNSIISDSNRVKIDQKSANQNYVIADTNNNEAEDVKQINDSDLNEWIEPSTKSSTPTPIEDEKPITDTKTGKRSQNKISAENKKMKSSSVSDKSIQQGKKDQDQMTDESPNSIAKSSKKDSSFDDEGSIHSKQTKSSKEEESEVVDNETEATLDNLMSKDTSNPIVPDLAFNNASTNPTDALNNESENETTTDSVQSTFVKDSVKTISDPLPDKSDSSEFTPERYITIDPGIAYNLGWTYSSIGKEANGISPTLGFSYINRFKPKFSFSIGLNYQFLGNMAQSSISFTSQHPSFGKNDSITIIETNRLHYAVVPLLLYYHVNPKNAFGTGISLSYLFYSNNHVIFLQQTDVATEQISSTKGSNYFEGFHSYDLSLNFSYKRKISNKIDFIALINYGFIDIKQANTFNLPEEIAERNIYLRATLTYNLSK